MGNIARLAVLVVLLFTSLAWARDGVVVSGHIKNAKGVPVTKADILVVAKTWPGGRFSMKPLHVKTDTSGAYSLPIMNESGKHAVNIAVVADGYAFVSHYASNSGSIAFEPKLDVAHPLTVRFVDDKGKPVAGVVARVAGRTTSNRQKHMIYPQGAHVIQKTSDKKGLVAFADFADGDCAEISVTRPGAKSVRRAFTVKGKKNEIIELAPIAPMPDEDLLVGKDKNKRYFHLGPKPGDCMPPEGYGLLLVMAGGGGGEEFRQFARSIYLQGAPSGMILAHLVSVKWTPDQRVVWPTEKSKVKGAKFTTEEFIDAVVKDVGKRNKIDPRRVYTLSWSSSGPAAYAAALRKTTPVAGSFVAMSVFRENDYKSLKPAKGRPFYIYHSPDDTTCRIRLAEDARDQLRKKGALVEFETYKGGHGWQSTTKFESIRKGLDWLDARLEEKAPKKK